MSAHSLRFVHASDLHLETALGGLRAIPDHLRDLLIEAPYAAAQRMFETAVLENVDFLLLAGDVLDARAAGPRAIAFLRDQFEMLDQNGIAVYWIGGRSEMNGRWPETVALPDGVHIFSSNRVEEVSHFRNDTPIATIAGQSFDGRLDIRPGEFRGERGGPTHIALAYGHCPEEGIADQQVTYWALGSEHNRRTVTKPPSAAHYCGATQGRSVRDPGPHGCQLVTITGSGEVRGAFTPTDSVRWRIERLGVKDKATFDDLRARMSERLTHVIGKEPGQTLLVRWVIEANETLARQLARPRDYNGLLDELRKEFGMGKSAAWSVEIEVTPPDEVAADRFNEDTILGDFLRSARQLQDDDRQPLAIQQLLGDDDLTQRCAEMLAVREPDLRRRVLHEATLLGLDLLTGEDAA